MIKYTTIATEDGRFQLSALMNDDKEHSDVTLTINDPEDGEILDIWDNSEWVMGDLSSFLKKYLGEPRTPDENVERELDTLEVFDDEYDKLLKLLEKGEEVFFHF